MVLDVWQASLMRAFAKQRLRQDQQLAAEAGLHPDQLEDSSDDEVSRHAPMLRHHNHASLVVHRLQSGCDTGHVCGLQVLDCCCAMSQVACRHQGQPWNCSCVLLTCPHRFRATLYPGPYKPYGTHHVCLYRDMDATNGVNYITAHAWAPCLLQETCTSLIIVLCAGHMGGQWRE